MRVAELRGPTDVVHATTAIPSTDMGRPTIVCLCGSMRREFADAWRAAYREETQAGKAVFMAGVLPGDVPFENDAPNKPALDALHKRKIDLADEILVLNVGGYIGDSTLSEINHARAQGKTIRWLEPPAG